MIISKELCVLVCVGYAFIFKNMQKRMNLKLHTQKQAYQISSSKDILWATLQMQGEFQWYLKQCLASPFQSWRTVCASGGCCEGCLVLSFTQLLTHHCQQCFSEVHEHSIISEVLLSHLLSFTWNFWILHLKRQIYQVTRLFFF